MSINNYIWSTSLDGAENRFQIEETNLEDARRKLIQQIENPDMIVSAIVFGETPFCPIVHKELTLCDYIITSFPTIRPV